MTEPKPDLSWTARRRELRTTVTPPPDGAVDASRRPIHTVDLVYRWEPATAAETGVPENGWAFVQVEVFELWQGLPCRMTAVYDENALNSPLGQVPDWIYALLREHEPPEVGELEASAADAWRNVHEMQRELDSLQRLLAAPKPVSTGDPALDRQIDQAAFEAGLQHLYEEAVAAVGRAIGLARDIGHREAQAAHADEQLDPEAVAAVAVEAGPH